MPTSPKSREKTKKPPSGEQGRSDSVKSNEPPAPLWNRDDFPPLPGTPNELTEEPSAQPSFDQSQLGKVSLGQEDKGPEFPGEEPPKDESPQNESNGQEFPRDEANGTEVESQSDTNPFIILKECCNRLREEIVRVEESIENDFETILDIDNNFSAKIHKAMQLMQDFDSHRRGVLDELEFVKEVRDDLICKKAGEFGTFEDLALLTSTLSHLQKCETTASLGKETQEKKKQPIYPKVLLPLKDFPPVSPISPTISIPSPSRPDSRIAEEGHLRPTKEVDSETPRKKFYKPALPKPPNPKRFHKSKHRIFRRGNVLSPSMDQVSEENSDEESAESSPMWQGVDSEEMVMDPYEQWETVPLDSQPSTSSAPQPIRFVLGGTSQQKPPPEVVPFVISPARTPFTPVSAARTKLLTELPIQRTPAKSMESVEDVLRTADDFSKENWSRVTPKKAAQRPISFKEVPTYLKTTSTSASAQESKVLPEAEVQPVVPSPSKKTKKKKTKLGAELSAEEQRRRDAEEHALLDKELAKKAVTQGAVQEVHDLADIMDGYLTTHRKFRKNIQKFQLTSTSHMASDDIQIELLSYFLQNSQANIQVKRDCGLQFLDHFRREYRDDETPEGIEFFRQLEILFFYLGTENLIVFDVAAIQSKSGSQYDEVFLRQVMGVMFDKNRQDLKLITDALPSEPVDPNSSLSDPNVDRDMIAVLREKMDTYIRIQGEIRQAKGEEGSDVIRKFLNFQFARNEEMFERMKTRNYSSLLQQHKSFYEWHIVAARTGAEQNERTQLIIRMLQLLCTSTHDVTVFDSYFMSIGERSVASYCNVDGAHGVMARYLTTVFPFVRPN